MTDTKSKNLTAAIGDSLAWATWRSRLNNGMAEVSTVLTDNISTAFAAAL